MKSLVLLVIIITLSIHWIQRKKYPSKWKSINYQYYKSVPNTTTLNKNASKLKSNDKKKEDTVTEGLHIFHLPEESVRKLTVQQLFEKGMEVLPPESWFCFGIHAQMTKSFNSTSSDAMQLREKLIQIKCLCSWIYLLYVIISSHFTKLFETEPYNLLAF